MSSMHTIEQLLQDKSVEHAYISIYKDTTYNPDEMRQDMTYPEFARLVIRAYNRAKGQFQRTFTQMKLRGLCKVYLNRQGYRITEKQMTILCDIANSK